jgi:large subunit ribosomal protein L31
MKANIHPKWYNNAKVTCTCGNTFTTGSTQPTIDVDICSACHPFFTGEMKFVDRQGRVDKFKKKMEQAEKARALREKEISEKNAKQSQEEDVEEKSYQDILREKQAALRQTQGGKSKSDSSKTSKKSDDNSSVKQDDKKKKSSNQ